MDPSHVDAALAETLPRLFQCSPAPQGAVRVRTPLLYPDGGVVEVFLSDNAGGYTASDFGQALGWLRMQTTCDRRSPEQNRAIEESCQTLGVELQRGQLVLRLEEGAAIADAVLRLALAVVQVSERCFTLCTPSTAAPE